MQLLEVCHPFFFPPTKDTSDISDVSQAAAILSHLSPSSSTGTSLPEDRSLWPSFLSGGTLPPPCNADITSPTSLSYTRHPISSSVPASSTALGAPSSSTRATSAGPRLHDYAIPASAHASGGITQLRPGLLGVPTGPGAPSTTGVTDPSSSPSASGSLPVPVPNAPDGSAYRHGSTSRTFDDGPPESWGSHTSAQYASATGISGSFSGSGSGAGGGGWSLPRSSLRSVSGSSRSRSGSGSGSRSDEEEEEESEPVDVDVELELAPAAVDAPQRYGFSSRGRTVPYAYGHPSSWKREEEEELRLGFSVREEDEYEEAGKEGQGQGQGEGEDSWDGMDMDMDMD